MIRLSSAENYASWKAEISACFRHVQLGGARETPKWIVGLRQVEDTGVASVTYEK